MRIFLISDNVDTLTGFRLAGINGEIVHTKEELKNTLGKVLKDETVGILMIMETLARDFPEIVDEVRLNRSLPLVVLIPNRHGLEREKDFITAYIREAIGVKL